MGSSPETGCRNQYDSKIRHQSKNRRGTGSRGRLPRHRGPQTVPGSKTLISITIDGVSYYFKKSEDFTDGNGYEIFITVTLSGDASLVKKALIHIGYTADEMIETVCPVKDGAFSSIYYGLEPGVTYYCKASISNGIETKTSETFSFTVPAGTT